MGKSLFIAEKPSVAQEFARALKISGKKGGTGSSNRRQPWSPGASGIW